jgi:hypothetical protein
MERRSLAEGLPWGHANALAMTGAPRKTPRKLSYQTSSLCILLELHIRSPSDIALLGHF